MRRPRAGARRRGCRRRGRRYGHALVTACRSLPRACALIPAGARAPGKAAAAKAETALFDVASFLGPLGGQITFGSITGFCSGMALKQLGRAAASILGLGFLLVQVRAAARLAGATPGAGRARRAGRHVHACLPASASQPRAWPQGLAYTGHVKVNWSKVQSDVMKAVDPDNDGQITISDLKYYWRKLVHVLTFNMPGSAGFALGLYMGLRSG